MDFASSGDFWHYLGMILVTHALVGAALTHQLPGATAAFFVGYASHYLMDMIPHWHYRLPRLKDSFSVPPGKKSIKMSFYLLPDFLRIGVDLLLGYTLSLLLFDASLFVITAGITGAILPDMLVGLARFWNNKMLVWHDTFHKWIHAVSDLDQRPILGVSTQATLSLIFVFLFG